MSQPFVSVGIPNDVNVERRLVPTSIPHVYYTLFVSYVKSTVCWDSQRCWNF